MKLKTFDDIGFLPCSGDDIEQLVVEASVDKYKSDIRRAAREWIKELEKHSGYNKLRAPDKIKQFACICDESDETYNVINWIKHFFNLED